MASQEEFELSYGETFTFSMNNSNDTAVELIPGGGVIEVTYVQRHEFVESLVAMRVREVDAQCEAIRRGLLKACIPAPVLGLWSVQEFQLGTLLQCQYSLRHGGASHDLFVLPRTTAVI